MKAMGIDFGLARIGIALSDDTKFLASPYLTYKRKGNEEDVRYFVDLVKTKNVDEIVCGLPMNMNGEEQEIALKTREFMNEIKQVLDVKIEFVDERLCSLLAEDMLKQTEKDWKKRKEKLDSVAASIILQDYLDGKTVNVEELEEEVLNVICSPNADGKAIWYPNNFKMMISANIV